MNYIYGFINHKYSFFEFLFLNLTKIVEKSQKIDRIFLFDFQKHKPTFIGVYITSYFTIFYVFQPIFKGSDIKLKITHFQNRIIFIYFSRMSKTRLSEPHCSTASQLTRHGDIKSLFRRSLCHLYRSTLAAFRHNTIASGEALSLSISS